MRVLTKWAVLAAAPVVLAACVSSTPEPPMVELDIVETAVSADDFNTLVTAVQTADLVEVLQSPGPFTVFAPTDEAFAALPPGTVESLLLEENRDQLVAILTYHVVPGEVFSTDLAGQVIEVETVEGSLLAVDATDGVVLNGTSTVVAADVDASNGVIHVIDTVLLPPM